MQAMGRISVIIQRKNKKKGHTFSDFERSRTGDGIGERPDHSSSSCRRCVMDMVIRSLLLVPEKKTRSSVNEAEPSLMTSELRLDLELLRQAHWSSSKREGREIGN